MNKIVNPLEKKYTEFLELIETLCECYDESGKDILALSISTAIRVLVHDTKSSTSLLTHLNRKNIKFLSTNFKNDIDPVHMGLVRQINVDTNDDTGGEAKYWPLCDERYFPSPKDQKLIGFEQWWGEEVFCSKLLKLTRKDLILYVTNKDGGTYFDAKVEKKYDAFLHTWPGGSTIVGTKSKMSRGYDNVPVYPAIRQIGYELLCTLKPQQI